MSSSVSVYSVFFFHLFLKKTFRINAEVFMGQILSELAWKQCQSADANWRQLSHAFLMQNHFVLCSMSCCCSIVCMSVYWLWLSPTKMNKLTHAPFGCRLMWVTGMRMHFSATWQIWLHDHCSVTIQPYVRFLRPFVLNACLGWRRRTRNREYLAASIFRTCRILSTLIFHPMSTPISTALAGQLYWVDGLCVTICLYSLESLTYVRERAEIW